MEKFELPKNYFITAISNQKIIEYLPKEYKMVSFPDHYTFLKRYW